MVIIHTCLVWHFASKTISASVPVFAKFILFMGYYLANMHKFCTMQADQGKYAIQYQISVQIFNVILYVDQLPIWVDIFL